MTKLDSEAPPGCYVESFEPVAESKHVATWNFVRDPDRRERDRRISSRPLYVGVDRRSGEERRRGDNPLLDFPVV